MDRLVSTKWLQKEMKKPDWKSKYRIIDATYDSPAAGRDLKKEFMDCRIPGAKFFDLVNCANKSAAIPNTIPTPEFFEKYVTDLGISNEHHVIVYDNSVKFGVFTSPRAWWLFNLFGHEEVYVLDGGLPKWKKDGCETASGEISSEETVEASKPFKADFKPERVVDYNFMKENVKSGDAQVLDARPATMYKVDHIPNAISFPFFENVNKETKVFLPLGKLRTNFSMRGIDLEKGIVASCISGISSTLLLFVIYLLKKKHVPLYDDGWLGWQKENPR